MSTETKPAVTTVKPKLDALESLIAFAVSKTSGENADELVEFLGTDPISNSIYEDATGENLKEQVFNALDEYYSEHKNFDLEIAKREFDNVSGNFISAAGTGAFGAEGAAISVLGPIAIIKTLFDLTKYFTRDKYEPILQKTLGDMARYDNDVGNTAKNFLEAGYSENENMQDIILASIQTGQDYYELRDKFFVGDFDFNTVRKELAIPYTTDEPDHVTFDDVKYYLKYPTDKRGRENVPYNQANRLIKELVNKLQTQKDENLPLTDVFTDFGIELTDDDLGSLESISDILGTVFTGDTVNEEIVDVAEDDTTETLLADTTEEDTTENITEEVVEKIEEEEVVEEDETEQDSITNLFPEKQRPSNEPDTSNQIEWLDEIPAAGQSIVKKMLEMDPDANVSKEQILFNYFFDGRPDYRAISNFNTNYSKWKSRQPVESDTPILDSIDSTLTDGIPILKIGDKTIKIPIFGGSAKEGLNATVDADGNVKVSIGVNKDGVIVEQELGSLEEVQEKINTSISEGKTKVEDAQEDISGILSLLFGTEENDKDKTKVTTGENNNNNNNNNDNNNGTSVTSGGADDEDKDKTKISDVENEDETKVSSAGLFGSFGAGGKGAQPELGKFQPLSIVDPVAPVSAADMYRRPQYVTKSLFSEYFK